MKKQLLAISISATALLFGGCATKPDLGLGFVPGSCKFDKDDNSPAPDWHCAPQHLFPKGYNYAKGAASTSITDINLKYTVAMQSARVNMARQAQAQVIDDFKMMLKASGVPDSLQNDTVIDVLSQVKTDLQLPPVEKLNESFDGKGNMYVLARTDKKALAERVEKKFRDMERIFRARLEAIENMPQQAFGSADAPVAEAAPTIQYQ